MKITLNVRAEHEITRLLEMVHNIHQHLGLSTKADQELEEMKRKTDLEEIKRSIDEQLSDNDSIIGDLV